MESNPKIVRTLKSGHKAEKVSEEESRRLQKLLTFYEDFVKIQPGDWFYGSTFPDVFDKYYDMKCRSSDIFVMALPKSGLTWTLEIVWTLINNPNLDNPEAGRSLDVRTPQLEIDFTLRSPKAPKLTDESEAIKYLKEKIPDRMDENFISLSLIDASEDPRIMKTHVAISLLPKEAEKSKIIYVVRDARDVIVSGYDFFCRYFHNYKGTLDDFIESFLNKELYYHPYWNHVEEAYNKKNLPNILILYYEDLKADPVKEYSKISKFLGLERTPQQIQNIVDYTSFSNMKKMTEEGKMTQPSSDGGRFIAKDEQNVGFYRKGIAGGWKNSLNAEQIGKINTWMEKNLEAFPDDFKYKQK